jgi:hypothetical protein
MRRVCSRMVRRQGEWKGNRSQAKNFNHILMMRFASKKKKGSAFIPKRHKSVVVYMEKHKTFFLLIFKRKMMLNDNGTI